MIQVHYIYCILYFYYYYIASTSDPWRRERLPTPVFWPEEFHGLYSPWGCKELDRLSDFHSFIHPTSDHQALGPGGWRPLVAQTVKHLPTMWETRVRRLGREDPLGNEMATHSNTLAWKILWMEEPGRLQSMGLQRVRHD